MATETRRSRILIEDWTGVTTSNVIPADQERWYDTVTGYQTTEIIHLVGDGSTTIASLLKRQELTDGVQTLYGVKTFDDIPELPASSPTTDNQATRKAYVDALVVGSFDVIDTDSGDVAATTPSTPADGEEWTVYNSGSSGNYVTGLPNSISLGDGKMITLRYDDTNTQWIYEDVVIEENLNDTWAEGTYTYKKYAGGSFKIHVHKDTGSTAINVFTYPFTVTRIMSVAGSSVTSVNRLFGAADVNLLDIELRGNDPTTGAASGIEYMCTIEGRWKSGV